jgi:hypothetical protein
MAVANVRRRGMGSPENVACIPLSLRRFSVKKRLTFSFLPWVAAAGVCVGGSFARSDDGFRF